MDTIKISEGGVGGVDKLYKEGLKMQNSNGRIKITWVSIDMVLPNPFNPRKDHTAETEYLQKIIDKWGWRESLGVYRKGEYFILLKGHRRWYAAKQLGYKEVPVIIQDKPETVEMEIGLMADDQAAHVDWTKYEWAKFYYNIWEELNKPTIAELARITGKDKDFLKESIRVFEYFPRYEIETKLENKTYYISTLFRIARWLDRFKEVKPELFQSLTGDIIRKLMLEKYERNRISQTDLAGDLFIEKATNEQIRMFLTSKDMSIKQAQTLLGVEKDSTKGKWQSDMQKIALLIKNMSDIMPKNDEQRIMFIKWLDMLSLEIKKKKKDIA